jgi:outer membrane immunogenic protein
MVALALGKTPFGELEGGVMKALVLAATAALGLAASAHAADMPVKAAPAVVAAAYDWSGGYFGIHGGGAWGKVSGIHDIGSAPAGSVDLSRLKDHAAIFGAQVGYNWQRGALVLGVEVDGSKGLGGKSTVAGNCAAGSCFDVTNKIDWLFSARARLGWALGETGNWLPFVTAGWGHVRHEYGAFENPGFAVGGPSGTLRIGKSGFVGGGGLEYGFRWARLRVEYLHYHTGRTRALANDELVDTDTGDFVRYRHINVVRGALSIPFGGGPVVARY